MPNPNPTAAAVEALEQLLAACIEEYGDPDLGEADESVGWTKKTDGTTVNMPFTFGHMQRAREALAALRSQGDGWKPIETAPKDGTRIMVAGGGAEQVDIAVWNSVVAAWDLDHTMLEDYDDQPEGYSRPLYWQPLPAPPQPQHENEVTK